MFFLGEIYVDLALPPSEPVSDHCGSCSACITICPTQAIVAPHKLDARRCISYLTIELKDADLPSEFKGKMENWAFGCDICQDVCPWNRFSKIQQEAAFEPHPEFLNLSSKEWEALSEESFRMLFGKSAIKRTKFNGLQRNIQFLKNYAGKDTPVGNMLKFK